MNYRGKTNMRIYENNKYMDDIEYVAELKLPWEKLQGKSILVSGATGMIGSFFIDVLIRKNEVDGLNCNIFALGRDRSKAFNRFGSYLESCISFISYDVNKSLMLEEMENIDFVIHLASNTHPLQYSLDPIGTITTNILGLKNMLDFAEKKKATRFVFASSNEVYGENRGDEEFFDEKYCGYINSNTLRAGYPESKRCGESLCQAYKKQMGMDIVVPRFTRTYGPTMLMSDTKAISQFIKKGVMGENIVLKSVGEQYYSYQYVADSVSGLLTILLCGENGEAYNIAEENSDIMLKDLANIISGISGKKVVFEKPDEIEAAGYSKATKARLDGSKLQRLGWKPKYNIYNGIERTIMILKEISIL